MKKMKKLIMLIVFLLLFDMLHCYIEWKFNNDSPKGIIELIDEWTDQIGLHHVMGVFFYSKMQLESFLCGD